MNLKNEDARRAKILRGCKSAAEAAEKMCLTVDQVRNMKKRLNRKGANLPTWIVGRAPSLGVA